MDTTSIIKNHGPRIHLPPLLTRALLPFSPLPDTVSLLLRTRTKLGTIQK